jgi:hypothetical protein
MEKVDQSITEAGDIRVEGDPHEALDRLVADEGLSRIAPGARFRGVRGGMHAATRTPEGARKAEELRLKRQRERRERRHRKPKKGIVGRPRKKQYK